MEKLHFGHHHTHTSDSHWLLATNRRGEGRLTRALFTALNWGSPALSALMTVWWLTAENGVTDSFLWWFWNRDFSKSNYTLKPVIVPCLKPSIVDFFSLLYRNRIEPWTPPKQKFKFIHQIQFTHDCSPVDLCYKINVEIIGFCTFFVYIWKIYSYILKKYIDIYFKTLYFHQIQFTHLLSFWFYWTCKYHVRHCNMLWPAPWLRALR